MINYNILNEFIEKLKSAGVTHEDLINVANAYKDEELQGTLTAGDNISINENVISATDTTYTAGDNINISNENVISATDTTYTAGTGIDITGNVISGDYEAGDNITIVDGVISATDGRGSIYKHHLSITHSTINTLECYIDIINNSSTVITFNDIYDSIVGGSIYNCYGKNFLNATTYYVLTTICKDHTTGTPSIYGYGSSSMAYTFNSTYISITDTVTQLL